MRLWSTRGNNPENGQKRITQHIADAPFLRHNGVNRSGTSFAHPRFGGTSKQRGSAMPTFLPPSSRRRARDSFATVTTGVRRDGAAAVRAETAHHEPSFTTHGFN